MIRTVKIEINAANPQLPLTPAEVFEDSAVTFIIIGIPRAHGKQTITGVSVGVINPDGQATAIEAVRDGSAWIATMHAADIGGSGTVKNGILISASGKDENDSPVEAWILGAGDLVVMQHDGTIKPGERLNRVDWFETAPESPKIGNLAPLDGIIKIYTSTGWTSLGGFVTIDWANVTNKPTEFPPEAHTHTKSEITDFPTAMPPTAHSHASDSWFTSALEAVKKWATNAFAAITHSHASDNWFTTALAGKIAKTGGTATDLTVVEPLTIQSSTGGKYAMFSVGTVDGVLYISGASDLNVESSGRTLNQINDKLNELDDGKANVSDLRYTLYAVPSTGLLKDRAINTTSLESVTVPDDFTDLLIRASVASSLAVTMPSAITTKYGDTFPAAEGEYLITITKTGAAEAYVRVIKLEVANA